MTTQPQGEWTARITGPEFDDENPPVPKPLDGGGALLVPVQVRFRFEKRGVEIAIVLDVRDGRPVLTHYEVSSAEGGPALEMLSTEITRGLKFRDLMSHAVRFAAFDETGDNRYTFGAGSTTSIESALRGVKARRLPMTDDRLRLTADAYRTDGYLGVEQIEGWQVGRRQAQRAVEKAVERGFLDQSEVG